MGEDADQFAAPGDNSATVEDAAEDDLLGGGGSNFPALDGGADEMSGFESSFPAIDTTNEVSTEDTPTLSSGFDTDTH